MAKVKPHRKKPVLDMTPVVDLAFLLVTFFMLTAKFRPQEPVVVDTPGSSSDMVVKDEHLVTLSVSNDDRVFFNIDNNNTRYNLINALSTQRNLGLTKDEMLTYANLQTVGMPFNKLKSFLDMDGEERNKIKQDGIPVDSLNNELIDWLANSRGADGMLRFAIKADAKVSYATVKKVIASLQDDRVNVNKFNLITTLEKD